MKDSDLFQHQPLHVKMWRYRYYLNIPFYTLQVYFYTFGSLMTAYSIAIGMAQSKMKWIYPLNKEDL